MILTFSCMQSCITVARTRDRLHVGHVVMKHNKMCSLPYMMTANDLPFNLFPFKTSLFIKRMSLINKVNSKKCFSENYKRIHLTTRFYSIISVVQ